MDITWIPQKVEMITTTPELYEGIKRIERMARICYQSESKIENTVNRDFIRRLISMGHESVLEHMNVSFIFTTDRMTTHQLVRHRLCAYSQESQRYCMYKNSITLIEQQGIKVEDLKDHAEACIKQYEEAIKNKMKAEDARAFLPQYVKTQIGVTANIREWRTILKLRTSKKAQPQIRALMLGVLESFEELGYGWLFDDIDIDYSGVEIPATIQM